MTIALWLIGYCAVGVIIGSLLSMNSSDFDSGAFLLSMLFWPIAVAFFLLLLVAEHYNSLLANVRNFAAWTKKRLL